MFTKILTAKENIKEKLLLKISFTRKFSSCTIMAVLKVLTFLSFSMFFPEYTEISEKVDIY